MKTQTVALLALAGLIGGCAAAPRRIDKKVAPAASLPAGRTRVCAGLVERADPLEEGNNLIVRAGDSIVDLGATVWGASGARWQRKGDVIRFRVAGRTVQAVPLIWAGNGAAIVLLTESATGLCVINVWALAWGGNGVDLQTVQLEPSSPRETLIRLELVGHSRGYYATPGDEGSYVGPSDQLMHAVIGTDGTRAWMIAPCHPEGRPPSGAEEAP